MKLRTLSCISALFVISALLTACGGGPNPGSLAPSQQRQDEQVIAEGGTPVDATPKVTTDTTSTATPAGTPPKKAATGHTLDAAAMSAAKSSFSSTCGACHTLKDAAASGQVGPDLDSLGAARLTYDHVLAQITNGGGGMPPGMLTGTDAQNVAAYVSTVAGK